MVTANTGYILVWGTLSCEDRAELAAVLGSLLGMWSFLFLSLKSLMVSSCPLHSTCPSGHSAAWG